MSRLSIRQDSHLYIAKIFNISKNIDITDYIDNCNITLPRTSEISSMEASFILDEKLVDSGNEVKIEILDEVGNLLYELQGMATLEKRNKSYTGKETFTYSIKDSYDKLFDKVVPETMVFFDLFFCNTKDKHNSLLHIVANKLGFRDDQIDFKDIAFDDGSLMRVPFVLFEQDERWVDILQRFIKATDSILYIKNKKLFSRTRNFMLNDVLKFDRTNIITEVEEAFKSTLYNGIRVNYDRFIKLENQVVFNLAQKVIINPYTRLGAAEVQAMKITYTTSSVSNPTLTKATGYYFTKEDDIKSKVDVNLVKDYHYKIEEWKETQAIVKFFNPYPYKLYIENFEIKGLPLVKYQDNESIIKNPNIIEKSQENFISIQKNREVQTEKLAKHIALSEYKAQILNNKNFNFNTYFLKDIELGEVYSLELEDINTVVRVTNIQISLKPAQFEMRIETECVENNGDFNYSSILSGKGNNNFIELKNLEEKINENSKNLRVLDRDVRSKIFRQKTEPNISDVKENDIWVNPDTNVWKKFYNGVWNPISEDEILPAMKMYNSIDGNIIKLQGTADKVGAYLLNNGEKFGSLNGELAHVTFDKMGQFEAENPNNRIALNIKDPANPSRVTSQILLGVTDITDPRWKNTIFAIGDEASPNRIEFKNREIKQFVNGEDISKTLDKQKWVNAIGTGKMLYLDPEFKKGANSTVTYNNHKNGLIETFVWEAPANHENFPPNTSGKVLVIRKQYGDTSPNCGGFFFATQSRSGAVFITRLIAKIPLGFSIEWASNSIGADPKYIGWITSNLGTGKYEEYIWVVQCGTSGGFSTTNFYFLSAKNGDNKQAVEWYVAYATVFDCTANSQELLLETQESSNNAMNRANNAYNLADLSQNRANLAYNYAGTVQGALETGDFTITGKTNFDGLARFISRGTNEVITIENGAIDFYRGGYRLTRIRNFKYGVIATNSQGSGVVNFDGFQQPMVVLTTVKSANFGKNMASIFCYAEHLGGVQYRFYVGASTEDYREASPIKVIGTTWYMGNVVISTLLGITGFTEKNYVKNFFKRISGLNVREETISDWQSNYTEYDAKRSYLKVLKLPSVNIKVRRNGEVIFDKNYNVNFNYTLSNSPYLEYYIEPLDISTPLNILKRYQARTDVRYILEINILESRLEIQGEHILKRYVGNGKNGSDKITYTTFNGVIFSLNQSHFKNLSITASAETSTISNATGSGEVQYIAMEVD